MSRFSALRARARAQDPDAIPLIGLVDDLVFIPLAVALAVRFVPAVVLAECRSRSRAIVAAWATAVVLIAPWSIP